MYLLLSTLHYILCMTTAPIDSKTESALTRIFELMDQRAADKKAERKRKEDKKLEKPKKPFWWTT